LPWDIGVPWAEAAVLSPVDLAVSKLARFDERDRDDIRTLIQDGLLTDAETFRRRAEEALAYYIGDLTMVRYAIRDVTEWIQDHRHEPPAP